MTTAVAEGGQGARPAAVREALSSRVRQHIAGIAHLRETVSTNDCLLALPPEASHGWVVFADAQTGGRGRQGNRWWSPQGAGLYLSLGWRFRYSSAAALGPLSLRAGLAVAEALAPFAAHPLLLKWPNDILVDGAKLGGLLVETRACGRSTVVVVGVGVNVLAAPAREVTDGGAAVCLAAIAKPPLPACELLMAALIDAVIDALAAWNPADQGDWLARWRSLDALAGAPVSWLEAGARQEGIACGPAADGSLRVNTARGERRVSAGEVRCLRPALEAPAA